LEGNCKKKYKGVRKENDCSTGEWRFAYGIFVSASANLLFVPSVYMLTELTARSAFSYSFELFICNSCKLANLRDPLLLESVSAAQGGRSPLATTALDISATRISLVGGHLSTLTADCTIVVTLERRGEFGCVSSKALVGSYSHGTNGGLQNLGPNIVDAHVEFSNRPGFVRRISCAICGLAHGGQRFAGWPS
jgi:hypothetical protein